MVRSQQKEHEGHTQRAQSLNGIEALNNNLKELMAEVKQLGNLVKAQSGVFTQIHDLQVEVKSLSVEVINMRSELSHVGNVLAILMSKMTSTGIPVATTSIQSTAQPTLVPSTDEDDLENVNHIRKVASDYYDTHFSEYGFGGLTKTLFAILFSSVSFNQLA